MKAILILSVCLLSSLGFGYQGPGGRPGGGMPPAGGARPRMDFATMQWNLLNPLHLTGAEKAKAKKLVGVFEAKSTAMRKEAMASGGSFQTMRPKMQAMRADYEAQLGKILSKPQMAAYTKSRDEMRAKMRAQFGGGRGGGRPGGR